MQKCRINDPVQGTGNAGLSSFFPNKTYVAKEFELIDHEKLLLYNLVINHRNTITFLPPLQFCKLLQQNQHAAVEEILGPNAVKVYQLIIKLYMCSKEALIEAGQKTNISILKK